MSSSKSALDALNTDFDQGYKIQLFQRKYLNNIVEQDYRFITKWIKSILGLKSFNAATITITGIENVRMIQKGPIIGTTTMFLLLRILL